MSSLRACFLRGSKSSLVRLVCIGPDLPRCVGAGPELIEVLVLAEGIHGEEESFVAIRHELPLAREALERLAFEDALRAGEVVENAAVEDEEAGADQAVGLGLLGEAFEPALRVGFE